MECITYKEYLLFLKENATTKTDLDIIQKQLDGITEKEKEKKIKECKK